MFDFTYDQTKAKVSKEGLKLLRESYSASTTAQIEIIGNLVHMKIYLNWLNSPVFNEGYFNESVLQNLETFKDNLDEIYEKLGEISSQYSRYLETALKEQLKPK